eukprot:scaffold594_cov116-Isochrysis_galbana.AAC.8
MPPSGLGFERERRAPNQRRAASTWPPSGRSNRREARFGAAGPRGRGIWPCSAHVGHGGASAAEVAIGGVPEAVLAAAPGAVPEVGTARVGAAIASVAASLSPSLEWRRKATGGVAGPAETPSAGSGDAIVLDCRCGRSAGANLGWERDSVADDVTIGAYTDDGSGLASVPAAIADATPRARWRCGQCMVCFGFGLGAHDLGCLHFAWQGRSVGCATRRVAALFAWTKLTVRLSGGVSARFQLVHARRRHPDEEVLEHQRGQGLASRASRPSSVLPPGSVHTWTCHHLLLCDHRFLLGVRPAECSPPAPGSKRSGVRMRECEGAWRAASIGGTRATITLLPDYRATARALLIA